MTIHKETLWWKLMGNCIAKMHLSKTDAPIAKTLSKILSNPMIVKVYNDVSSLIQMPLNM